MATLKHLTRDNWLECSRLELEEHQQDYVASNLKTIAESRFEPHYHLRAIYTGDTMVGLIAFCEEDDPPDPELYWIFRLMIDRRRQQQGLGTAAIRLAIDEIKQLGARRIRTSYRPWNEVAARLYPKLGFREVGFHDDGDVMLELVVG